jgi:hypothetical protein
MNASLFGADAITHLKIIATALLAASVVVGVGLAARLSAPSPAATVAPAQPSNVPLRPSPVPA